MPVSIDQVKHVARLARLNLSPERIVKMTRELTVVLEYIDQLREVDTEGVEPRNRHSAVGDTLRADEVCPSLSQDQALANAPDKDGEFFRVPRVID